MQEEPLLLSNLEKPWYLYYNENNNVPICISAYDYTIIKEFLTM